ncbi:unnamed protein product [Rotaria magnacalcarata]|uniref:V-SNARE coiled-coil homology domain-containing protein n=1 Tax=Rotaria magnacalcarata TaxID=392030 RepID=A0A816WD12_9BILA|nr:unnamed protein product [Rotaria magnacalcarata]CAF1637099.1 unnamed protein product [Rotaria magnacalcarata]CAF2076802.1 unnamed protein product [Rotaria magnacalcarata]CAF2132047.1 unnamed protein product [Rotaria magnacalcarata]CAF2180127.1 unnamed protein product [Rotaria magnacalcarata]
MSDPVDNKTNNLNALRADVTETTNVLRVTVEKLVDRGDRLDALNARAEDLNSSSYHFHGSARRIQRTMKWRNYKITIFIIVVVLIVIGVIVLIALHPWKK